MRGIVHDGQEFSPGPVIGHLLHSIQGDTQDGTSFLDEPVQPLAVALYGVSLVSYILNSKICIRKPHAHIRNSHV